MNDKISKNECARIVDILLSIDVRMAGDLNTWK